MRALLPLTLPAGTTLVTNLGGANPLAAGELAVAVARECRPGRAGSPWSPVTTSSTALRLDAPSLEDGRPLSSYGEAGLGERLHRRRDPDARARRPAPTSSSTGRVADPSLFLAPLVHASAGISTTPRTAAAGTLVGHLLECAPQVTGGYFADPGTKDVAGLADLGYPFADVDRGRRGRARRSSTAPAG